jgi:hypothetical protein
VSRRKWGSGGFRQRVPASAGGVEMEPAFILAEPTLWAWAWTGVDGEHCTLEDAGSNRQRVVQLNDISGNARHYIRSVAELLTGCPWYEPGLDYVDASWGSYSTALAPIARQKLNSGEEVYGQYLQQAAAMNAAGEFYLAAACLNTRTGGTRYLWGGDGFTDRVRLSQGNVGDSGANRIAVTIAGNEALVSDVDTIPKGPVVIEVWRDVSNVIHIRANGVAVGNGATVAGTFALAGFGGGPSVGGAGWDDDLLELLACNGLPALSYRDAVVAQFNAKWEFP